MSDRVRLIFETAESQEPVLFLVAGEVWEGHVQSCLDGLLVAVARRAGAGGPYGEQRWDLDGIVDMARREADGDDEEDELLTQARQMTEQARDYSEMSLAERLLLDRATREEHR